jgi:hypothetical protein
MKFLSGLFLLALSALLFTATQAFCAATQPPGGRIDLSDGLSFEKYITTGTGVQMENAIDRLGALSPSESFLAAVEKIDVPIVIVAFTDISCPDCAVTIPYVETIQRVNPRVVATYFLRDDAAKVFLKRQSGRSAVPTLFVTDGEGAVMGGVYVEYPEAVQALIDSSSSEEASSVRGDFRKGRYLEEVEKDILKLIESALRELEGHS